MDYKTSATAILEYIGGEENIVNVEHCSTRLRFNVVDNKKVNETALKKVPGVMGVIMNAQVQIIIGNTVIEMYDALMRIYASKDIERTSKEKKKIGSIVLEYLVGIFQPLVPAIAGAGILKSILILISTLQLIETTNSTYRILLSISDATFYFMPIMVAVTTATKLKTNKMVAVAAVGVLLLPNMTTMLTEGATFLGIGLKSVAYNSQVFPAILCTLCLGFMEKQLHKITPKVIRSFFVPMVALAITIPLTLLFLGPLGYTLGEGLSSFIIFMYSNFGFIAVALVAAILPLMVATGMHKAMIPYVVSSMGSLGYEILYNAASLAHNISESGACFAVALKTKDQQTKSVAVSAGISALMGITEPALYGITLQNKVVLKAIMVSSGIVGAFLGFVGLKAFVAVGPGLASITMFVDPDNSRNLIFAFVGLILALGLSFLFTLVFWKDNKKQEIDGNKENVMMSPLEGTCISLSEVKDEMFSNHALGDGVAIIPIVGELRAPSDGIIKMVFDTKHAVGMETTNGTELLFHIGIDTVQLNGKYFETHVKANDVVKKGDLLVSFDIDKIKKEGYDVTTPIIVTNTSDFDIQLEAFGSKHFTNVLLLSERKAN